MNIYKISQYANEECDAFVEAIVIAKDEEEARNTHPVGGGYHWEENNGWPMWSWCHPSHVKVEMIGFAKLPAKREVICAS